MLIAPAVAQAAPPSQSLDDLLKALEKQIADVERQVEETERQVEEAEREVAAAECQVEAAAMLLDERPRTPGAVVALRGTPHLWFADEHGVLHWGGDTRALAGKHIAWSNRIEVCLESIRALPVGDPWLSAGLLKDGDPIYLVKWETNWQQPKLLHIQDIKDVELFGINGSNYGNFVLDKATWESRFGISAAGLERGVLERAVPAPR